MMDHNHTLPANLDDTPNLLDLLVDNLPHPIYVKDTEGRFVLCNYKGASVMGVAHPKDTIGKTDFDFYPPEVAQKFWADDQHVLETGEALLNYEEKIVDAAGHEQYRLTTKIPLFDNQHQIIGLVCLNHDITEHKKSQRAMEHEHTLMRTLLDNQPDFVFVKDKAGNFVINNASHLAALGVTDQREVVGKPSYNFFPPDLAEQLRADDRQVIEQNRPLINRRELVTHPTGTQRWYLTTKVPIHDNQNRVIGLIGISRDITPQKQAEDLLRQAHANLEKRVQERTAELARVNQSLQATIQEQQQAQIALRQSEQRYKLLLGSVTDYIYTVYVENGQVARTTHSPNCVAVTGYTHREYEHNPDLWYQMIYEPDRQAVTAQLDKLLAGQTVPPLEHRIIHKDGTIRWVKNTTVLRKDQSGNLISYDGLVTDITDRKEAECREMLAHELGLQLATVLNPEILLTETVNRLKDTLGYYHVHVYLAHTLEGESAGTQWLIVAEGTGEAGARLKQQKHAIPLHAKRSLVARAARQRQPVVVNDISQSPDHLPNVLLPHTRSEVALPLFVGQELIGVLDIQQDRVDHFNLHEIRTLEIVANQLSVALANARLFQEQQRLLEQVKAGQERLQHLSHRLVEVQEAERRHIARELHDEVGQLLTGLKLTLEMSQRLPPAEVKSSLAEPQALVNELIKQVRELSLELRPAMLDDLGLLPTLQWHFERYTAKTNIEVLLNARPLPPRLPASIETAAYRIIQEALTNVARHAHVNRATVNIWQENENLYIQIKDMGKGFDIKGNQTMGKSSGVSGMQERAVLLGGHLSIDTTPGNGTCITARFPLSSSDDD